MSAMRPIRRAHRRTPYPFDREKCRVCGYLRINVRHEMDPHNAPEGRAYYDENVPDRHEFIPSGTYDTP